MDHLRRMFEQASTPDGAIADFEIIPNSSGVHDSNYVGTLNTSPYYASGGHVRGARWGFRAILHVA